MRCPGLTCFPSEEVYEYSYLGPKRQTASSVGIIDHLNLSLLFALRSLNGRQAYKERRPHVLMRGRNDSIVQKLLRHAFYSMTNVRKKRHVIENTLYYYYYYYYLLVPATAAACGREM